MGIIYSSECKAPEPTSDRTIDVSDKHILNVIKTNILNYKKDDLITLRTNQTLNVKLAYEGKQEFDEQLKEQYVCPASFGYPRKVNKYGCNYDITQKSVDIKVISKDSLDVSDYTKIASDIKKEINIKNPVESLRDKRLDITTVTQIKDVFEKHILRTENEETSSIELIIDKPMRCDLIQACELGGRGNLKYTDEIIIDAIVNDVHKIIKDELYVSMKYTREVQEKERLNRLEKIWKKHKCKIIVITNILLLFIIAVIVIIFLQWLLEVLGIEKKAKKKLTPIPEKIQTIKPTQESALLTKISEKLSKINSNVSGNSMKTTLNPLMKASTKASTKA